MRVIVLLGCFPFGSGARLGYVSASVSSGLTFAGPSRFPVWNTAASALALGALVHLCFLTQRAAGHVELRDR